ncbi:MAG: hypothetical protein AB2705_22900, partial [Candidatus Thiodiazotropha sp.]
KIMTAYHRRKLPKLIGNFRIQAKVRPTFTFENCKQAKKQVIKIASIFNLAMKIGYFLNTTRKSENGLKIGRFPICGGELACMGTRPTEPSGSAAGQTM